MTVPSTSIASALVIVSSPPSWPGRRVDPHAGRATAHRGGVSEVFRTCGPAGTGSIDRESALVGDGTCLVRDTGVRPEGSQHTNHDAPARFTHAAHDTVGSAGCRSAPLSASMLRGCTDAMLPSVLVLGRDTCEDTIRSKALLAQRGIPFSYLKVDEDPAADAWIRRLNDGDGGRRPSSSARRTRRTRSCASHPTRTSWRPWASAPDAGLTFVRPGCR